jgi:hypothetical protein
VRGRRRRRVQVEEVGWREKLVGEIGCRERLVGGGEWL